MKLYIIIVLLLFCLVGNSCTGTYRKGEDAPNHRDTVYVNRVYTDTVIMRDTITMPPETIVTHIVSNYIPRELIILDSIETQNIMEGSLAEGRIVLSPINGEYPDCLFYWKDLEYMPYMMMTLSKPYPSWDSVYKTCLSYMIDICYHTIFDTLLQEYGKRYIDAYNEQIESEPPLMNRRGEVIDRRKPYPEQIGLRKISAIDSLRIKALIHNDRDALTKLEEHYRAIDYELGVAVYYKLMLGFEGNGDLAERFYRVLQPHFSENPRLKLAAKEVLTTAALRDGNQRAQELCDSLEYQLHVYD